MPNFIILTIKLLLCHTIVMILKNLNVYYDANVEYCEIDNV